MMGTDGILQACRRSGPPTWWGSPGILPRAPGGARPRDGPLLREGLALGGDQVTPGYRRRVMDLLRRWGRPRHGW